MSRAAIVRAVLCIGIPVFLAGGGAPEQAASTPPANGVRTLQEEKLAALKELAAATQKAYLAGEGNAEQVHRATAMLLETRLDLSGDDVTRLQVLRDAVKDAESWEAAVRRAAAGGARPMTDALAAKINLLDARIALEKAAAREKRGATK
jgi:outer membrane protein TolC